MYDENGDSCSRRVGPASQFGSLIPNSQAPQRTAPLSESYWRRVESYEGKYVIWGVWELDMRIRTPTSIGAAAGKDLKQG